jgi:hypothetical protein
VVFVAERGTYHAVVVQLLARNPDEVAVTGIAAGVTVALTDPDKKEAKK